MNAAPVKRGVVSLPTRTLKKELEQVRSACQLERHCARAEQVFSRGTPYGPGLDSPQVMHSCHALRKERAGAARSLERRELALEVPPALDLRLLLLRQVSARDEHVNLAELLRQRATALRKGDALVEDGAHRYISSALLR